MHKLMFEGHNKYQRVTTILISCAYITQSKCRLTPQAQRKDIETRHNLVRTAVMYVA